MNYSIEVMMEEHKNINRMIKVIRQVCIKILEGNAVDTEELKLIVDFIKNYSDKHHHGKEEDFLFPEMTKHLGKIADNLINHGMLVEHNTGRDYCMELSLAMNRYAKNPTSSYKLDIISSAMGYAKVLKNHTDKEDRVVYPYAEEHLAKELFEVINSKCKAFEEENAERRTHYLDMLNQLEKKYITAE